MLAMNWQTTDVGMMLNDAMFADTGGWVLKPRSYLGGNSGVDVADDGTNNSVDSAVCMEPVARRNLDLKITVLAAQFLPLPQRNKQKGPGTKFRSLVKVDLHVEKQHRSLDYSRETTPRETDNPDWGFDATPLEFLDVRNVVEEISFVR